MKRYYGNIGYEITTMDDEDLGVPKTETIVKGCYGEVLQNYRNLGDSEEVHQSIVTGNRISILADPYALNNFFNIKWIEWNSAKWTVKKVEVVDRRLILSLGELYVR